VLAGQRFVQQRVGLHHPCLRALFEDPDGIRPGAGVLADGTRFNPTTDHV
jgi:hypothetical protein